MVDQQNNVRNDTTCVACGGSKNTGLLLCWPCHHAQKRKHDAGYSREIEHKLSCREAELGGH